MIKKAILYISLAALVYAIGYASGFIRCLDEAAYIYEDGEWHEPNVVGDWPLFISNRR